MEASLSSASMNGPSKNSYFNQSSNSTSSSSSCPQSNDTTAAAQAHAQTQAPYQQQQYQAANQPHQPHQQSQQSQADGTSRFLRDFNLVAEAAKRAEIACLMRDLEAVGI